MSAAPEGTRLDPVTFRPINLFRAALWRAEDAIPPLETSLADLRLNPAPYPPKPKLALPAAPPVVLGCPTSGPRSPSSVGSSSPPRAPTVEPKAEPLTPPASRGKQVMLEFPPFPPSKYVCAWRVGLSEDDLLVDRKRQAIEMDLEGLPSGPLAPADKKARRSLDFTAEVDAACKDLDAALGPLKGGELLKGADSQASPTLSDELRGALFGPPSGGFGPGDLLPVEEPADGALGTHPAEIFEGDKPTSADGTVVVTRQEWSPGDQ
ncbi:unnamed protein product [Linum trigynum]|uniref:Uncharacterized protein n=1 Tax=Linum trigynum TaxID=586398 RepID=A0AAV2E756_9ROSI